jgi:GPH family glycoside/pentoside/hexuronide:cation symporter
MMVPLVKWVDASNQARGYQGAVAILAVTAVVMFLVCFATTRERIPADAAGHGTFGEDIRDIWKNDQWRVVGVLTLLNIMGVCVRGGTMIYYVTYFLGDADSSMRFLFTYFVGNIIGSALAKPLADRFCKVSLFAWLNLALCAASLAMYFVPPNAAATMFGFVFVIGILHQATTPIQWVMMSDTVDYGEWKQGKRLTGISFSGTLFVLKMGLALGGAIIGWTLDLVHYQKGLPHQSPAVMQGILLLFTVFPGLFYLLSALVSRRYTLRREFLGKILGELEARRV